MSSLIDGWPLVPVTRNVRTLHDRYVTALRCRYTHRYAGYAPLSRQPLRPRYTDRTRYTIRHATPRPRSTGPCPCPWPSGVMGSTAVPEGASAAGRILRMPLALPLAHRPGSGHAPALALGHPWPPPRRSINGAAFQRRWVRSAGRPGTPHVDPPYKPPPPGAAGLLRPGAGPSGSTATVEGPVRPA